MARYIAVHDAEVLAESDDLDSIAAILAESERSMTLLLDGNIDLFEHQGTLELSLRTT